MSLADDLAAIKAALDAGPTPGPWHRSPNSRSGFSVTADVEPWTVTEDLDAEGRYGAIEREQDAAYIAACSPDRIARLVEHVERLRDVVATALQAARAVNSGGFPEVEFDVWVEVARAALEGKE